MKKKVLLLISSLVVTFLFFEVFLRAFYPLETDPFFNRGLVSFGDVFRLSENAGIGIELMPDAVSIEGGVEYRINSKGLRDYEYSYDKPKNTFRILVFGDSSTMGFGVSLNDTFAKQLERLLSKDGVYEVINLGVGGYNTWQEFEYLKSEGLKYDPDLAVFSFFFNDIIKDSPSFINVTKKEKSCRISFVNVKIPCGVVDCLRKVRFFTFVKYRLNNIFIAKRDKSWVTEYYELHVDDFDKIFADISQFSKDENVPVLFLVFPFIISDYGQYDYKSLHEGIAGKMGEHNLTFLDLLEAYSQSSSPLYISKIDRIHPNAEGHRITANSIYEVFGL